MNEQGNVNQKEESTNNEIQAVDTGADIESEILKIRIPQQITALQEAARNGAPFCEEIAEIKEGPE